VPTNTAVPPTSRPIVVARLFGYFIFFVAFFLPACRQAGVDAGDAPEVYKGYFCAWITIINTFNLEVWKSKGALAILSGWTNPFMLVYVASLFSRKLRGFRRIVAIAALAFIVATWVYFYLAPMAPLIGHALWVAGILLILSGEFISPRVARSMESSSQAEL
jgi:hypothetical protein